MKYLGKIILGITAAGIIMFSMMSTPVIYAQENAELYELEGQWTILEDQSSFTFKATTLWLFPVKGTMGGVKGSIDFDKINTDGFVHLSLKPATLETGIDKRDDHLRSEDFFFVEKYPFIAFKGGSVTLKDTEKQIFNVEGSLTIRGVTHNESIPVRLVGYYKNDTKSIVFEGSTEIDRNRYNVDYTGRAISDKAKITYSIVAKKINDENHPDK